VTSRNSSGHVGWPGEARWAGRMAKTVPGRALADDDGGAPQRAARFDSLTHPVAITGQCVIGDQIRIPVAGCAMAGCESAFADPAALGEADNQVRAVTSGWARDDLGRLVCPACQRDSPVPPWWVYSQEPRPVSQDPRAVSQEPPPVSQEPRAVSQEPRAVSQEPRAVSQEGSAFSDRGPAISPPRPADGMSQPAGLAPAGRPPVAGEGRHHRGQWPRLLSALVSGRDGSAPRAGSRAPDTGAVQGQPQTPAPHHEQAIHAGHAGRRP
jgi:hypothetical protein